MSDNNRLVANAHSKMVRTVLFISIADFTGSGPIVKNFLPRDAVLRESAA